MNGSASYPIRLCEGEVVTFTYVQQTVAECPFCVPGCYGTPEQPTAAEGHFCAYEGYDEGARTEDVNASFNSFKDAGGEINGTGSDGELISFRTDEFRAGGPPLKLKAEARLNAYGGWAVTAK